MSVSEKVKCIDGNDKKLSISRQCELLQLPRSSYYRPRDCHIEDEENLELMRLIDEEFLRHPFYGSRKMKLTLRNASNILKSITKIIIIVFREFGFTLFLRIISVIQVFYQKTIAYDNLEKMSGTQNRLALV